jgi:hypothetical protein
MNALIFGLKLLDALGAVLFLPVDGSAGSPWDCEVPVPETGDSEELSSALWPHHALCFTVHATLVASSEGPRSTLDEFVRTQASRGERRGMPY